MSNNQKSDLDLANQALLALKINVTTSDRADSPRCEAITIQYLKGQGKDLDTAIELLDYFRERIEERRKKIIES